MTPVLPLTGRRRAEGRAVSGPLRVGVVGIAPPLEPAPHCRPLLAQLDQHLPGAAAKQGGEALLLTGPAGAFWPATGLGIAVLYLGGMRWWPGVLLG